MGVICFTRSHHSFMSHIRRFSHVLGHPTSTPSPHISREFSSEGRGGGVESNLKLGEDLIQMAANSILNPFLSILFPRKGLETNVRHYFSLAPLYSNSREKWGEGEEFSYLLHSVKGLQFSIGCPPTSAEDMLRWCFLCIVALWPCDLHPRRIIVSSPLTVWILCLL